MNSLCLSLFDDVPMVEMAWLCEVAKVFLTFPIPEWGGTLAERSNHCIVIQEFTVGWFKILSELHQRITFKLWAVRVWTKVWKKASRRELSPGVSIESYAFPAKTAFSPRKPGKSRKSIENSWYNIHVIARSLQAHTGREDNLDGKQWICLIVIKLKLIQLNGRKQQNISHANSSKN